MNKTTILDSPEILEKISEQVHNAWMDRRIKDGWSYGIERDDALKKTPCIVPYDKLPEIEKDYDRNTVRAVVNALYSLDYSISKKEL